MEGGREGKREEGRMEGGREGKREGGREGGRDTHTHIPSKLTRPLLATDSFFKATKHLLKLLVS